MNTKRTDAAAKKVAGSVKEAIGKVTGDTELQAEGAADQATGTAMQDASGSRDAGHDVGKT